MKLDDLFEEVADRAWQREPERLPRHVLLVEDEETGTVSYMTLLPDGHLGAVEEY